MTRQEIIDLFDSTQITMAELARISGQFNKTIKSNPYRNINARGKIPLVLLSSGETPPRMGPQSRRPRSKAAEPQSADQPH